MSRKAPPRPEEGRDGQSRAARVEVLAPAERPEAITVDLTHLDFVELGARCSTKLPEGCKPVSAKTDLTVVTIVMVEGASAAGTTTAAAPAAAPAASSGQGRSEAARAAAAANHGQEVRRTALPSAPGSAAGEVPAPRLRAQVPSGNPMLVIGGTRQSGRHARNRHNIGFMAIEAEPPPPIASDHFAPASRGLRRKA